MDPFETTIPYTQPQTLWMPSDLLDAAQLGSQPCLVFFDRDRVKALPLAEGEGITVGRGRLATISVPADGTLSRAHARFTLVDGEVWVEDHGSTNGTWVNGQRVTRPPDP